LQDATTVLLTFQTIPNDGRDIIRWFFADRKMAALFAKTSGGVSE
jgi:hypothetical protein